MRAPTCSRLAMIGGLCVALMGLQSCGGGGDGDGGGDRAGEETEFDVSLEMQALNGATRSSYTFGTPMAFALTVTNRSGASQSLSLPTNQLYDLAVLREGSPTPIWRWSSNRTFAPTSNNLAFTGYQSITYLYVWNGVLDDGTQLMPGTYDFRGTLAYSQYANDWRANDGLAAPIRKITITN